MKPQIKRINRVLHKGVSFTLAMFLIAFSCSLSIYAAPPLFFRVTYGIGTALPTTILNQHGTIEIEENQKVRFSFGLRRPLPVDTEVLITLTSENPHSAFGDELILEPKVIDTDMPYMITTSYLVFLYGGTYPITAIAKNTETGEFAEFHFTVEVSGTTLPPAPIDPDPPSAIDDPYVMEYIDPKTVSPSPSDKNLSEQVIADPANDTFWLKLLSEISSLSYGTISANADVQGFDYVPFFILDGLRGKDLTLALTYQGATFYLNGLALDILNFGANYPFEILLLLGYANPPAPYVEGAASLNVNSIANEEDNILESVQPEAVIAPSHAETLQQEIVPQASVSMATKGQYTSPIFIGIVIVSATLTTFLICRTIVARCTLSKKGKVDCLGQRQKNGLLDLRVFSLL